MAASRNDIHQWLARAKAEGATHMMVVCDTFDHDDYPVSVPPGKDVKEAYEESRKAPMQRVMEVYALHLDLDDQLNETRSFHFEYPETAA